MESSSLSRLLVYAHYDAQNQLDPHVRYQIAALESVCRDIIFVSNSPLDNDAVGFLAPLTSRIITRNNIGWDFGAWKEVLLELGPQGVSGYDEIILMNDSVYGPLFPLEEMFSRMAETSADYWGITRDDCQYYTQDYDLYFTEHLQSYFIVFKRRLFLNIHFWNFWLRLPLPKSLVEAIHLGELRMTRIFDEAGFIHASYADLPYVEPAPAIGVAPSLAFNIVATLVSRCRIPFIKVKAFGAEQGRLFKPGSEVFEALSEAGSAYPAELIANHIARAKPVSWSKNLPGFLNVFPADGSINAVSGMKIAAFAHAYYEDTFADALKYLHNIPCPFDLYVAATDSGKKEEFLNCAREFSPSGLRKLEIRIFENRGRDVAPWMLGFKDVQYDYDLALKFHLKKRVSLNETFTREWLRFMLKCTIASPAYVAQVINLFRARPNLGMAFHPYVPCWLLQSHHKYICNNNQLNKAYRLSLKKCGVKQRMETSFPIYPTNIFWYRPKALSRLFEGSIGLEDFAPEPCPLDGTLAHGLERSIPYIARAAGYEIAQVMPEDALLETYQLYEDHILNLECAGWTKTDKKYATEDW